MRRELIVVTALAAGSQISAFFKLWFTARIFGLSAELDGYNLALVIPTTLSSIFAGCLQTGLFPVRANLNAMGERNDVDAFERVLLLSVGAAGCIAAALLYFSNDLVMTYFSPRGLDPSVQNALQIVAPSVSVLVGLSMLGDTAGYILAMRRRFAVAAGAPIINGIIGGLVLASFPQAGLASLLVGTIVGSICQVGICIWGLHRSGLRLFGSLLPIVQARVLLCQIVALSAWIFPGVVLSNLVVSLPAVWVSGFGEGANSAFGYAYRLHSSTVQLLVMAGSPVILANFSDLIAGGEIQAVRSILLKTAAIALIIGATGVILVGTIGPSLLTYIFRGKFDADAAIRVSNHWWWMSTGVAFLIIGNVFAKLWQSQQRPKFMTLMAIISIITMIGSYHLLMPYLGEYGVAAAMSVAAVATVVVGARFLGLNNPDRHDTNNKHEQRRR